MNEGCTVTLGCIIIMLSVLHVRVDKHSMVVVMSHPSMLDTLFSSNTNTCMHASCCCCCWPASCLCGIKERLFVLLIMYGTSNCFVYLRSQEPFSSPVHVSYNIILFKTPNIDPSNIQKTKTQFPSNHQNITQLIAS